MRKAILFLCILCSANQALTQALYDSKRDYVWIFGGTYFTIDSSEHIFFDFKFDTMTLSHKRARGHNLFQTNASVCDTAGNFLFFSNGCVLADSGFQYIPGADTINQGPRWETTCGYFPPLTDGYVIVNGCWILPVAENKFKVFYIDFLDYDTANFDSGIRYSTVLRNAESGILSGYGVDRYLYEGSVDPTKRAVVRHGNGRDWWLVNPINHTKKHYVFLIDSSENVYPPVVNEFPEMPNLGFNTSGQACFSPDGSIYASFDYKNHCLISNFNRCNGEMSNLRIVKPLLSADSIFAVTGIAISPNSRYLYLMTNVIITQYDLLADSIAASAIVVAVRDNWVGYTVSGNPDYPPTFYQSQIGPDGKIYVFSAAGRRTFAVIESPDSAGMACHVIQHKYFFPQWGSVRQPPRFPNFRLGPLTGSPCDTLSVSSTETTQRPVAGMKLLPNPAIGYTVADISVPDYSASQHLTLALVDMAGREISRKNVPPYTSLQRIETVGLGAGLYFVRLYVQGRVAAVAKLVVARE